MKLGIIGAGSIGTALGALWQRAGHEVLLSSRHLEDAQVKARRLDLGSGTAEEASLFGEAVLLAVRWTDIATALEPRVVRALAGKTLVDATNRYGPDSIPTDPSRTQSENLARLVRQSHVVKAFNMMRASAMQDRLGKLQSTLAVLYCGDNVQAKGVVSQLIADAGFEPVDVGPLKRGAAFEVGAPLYDRQISALQATTELKEWIGKQTHD